MNDASGNNANCYAAPYVYPSDRTVAGEFQNSDSPYGTFDQGGNVCEWNEEILYDGTFGLRGGWFASLADSLGAAFRDGCSPTDEVGYVGFRVSEVPEPATLSLLALGGLALLRRRARTW